MDQHEELDIKTPAGSFAFKGSQMFCVILLCLLAGVTVFLLHQHDAKADTRSVVQIESSKQTEETLKVVIYVLSLPPEERAKLRLAEPKLLREMQR
jgi:hypothetical protein